MQNSWSWGGFVGILGGEFGCLTTGGGEESPWGTWEASAGARVERHRRPRACRSKWVWCLRWPWASGASGDARRTRARLRRNPPESPPWATPTSAG